MMPPGDGVAAGASHYTTPRERIPTLACDMAAREQQIGLEKSRPQKQKIFKHEREWQTRTGCGYRGNEKSLLNDCEHSLRKSDLSETSTSSIQVVRKRTFADRMVACRKLLAKAEMKLNSCADSGRRPPDVSRALCLVAR